MSSFLSKKANSKSRVKSNGNFQVELNDIQRDFQQNLKREIEKIIKYRMRKLDHELDSYLNKISEKFYNQSLKNLNSTISQQFIGQFFNNEKNEYDKSISQTFAQIGSEIMRAMQRNL